MSLLNKAVDDKEEVAVKKSTLSHPGRAKQHLRFGAALTLVQHTLKCTTLENANVNMRFGPRL